METQQVDYSPDLMIKRIDALIGELHLLRQQMLVVKAGPTPSLAANMVDDLAGSLGQGSWEEYDKYLDWERFSQ